MELSTGRQGWSPFISTGMYAYPVQQAAKIAIRTIRMMVDKHPEAFDEILWVLFDGRTKQTYDGALLHGQSCVLSMIKGAVIYNAFAFHHSTILILTTSFGSSLHLAIFFKRRYQRCLKFHLWDQH